MQTAEFPESDLGEAQFIKSEKGHPMLVDKSGYSYYKAKNSKKDSSKIFWRCTRHHKSKCPGRATTAGFRIIKYMYVHDHPPFETKDITV